MRRIQWMALAFAALALGSLVPAAWAQPGHAPFVFGALEIENYERTLAPAGIAGATIVNPALTGVASNHPCIVGNAPTACVTGAPIILDRVQSAWEQYGGILGHTPPGGSVTPTNYNDLFPGGTTVSPSGYPNGGPGRNQPNTPASYNGTKLSIVNRTDGNTQDDVAITSGNQALRVQMLNKGQGDGDTSFDRPAMLVIKEQDFWGVADSRFQTWEMVRATPTDFSISIDVTIIADEIPDVSATGGGFGPYLRLGFISGHTGLFDEGPPDLLQGPPSLLFSNGDADGDMLPNFSDPQWVDPGNTPTLPGVGVPGVIQRRYVFPASAMSFPANSIAGIPNTSNDENNGGSGNAYMFGFVYNGIWQLDTYASFFIDNIRVVDGFPTESADFNVDGFVNAADWQILRTNLNSLTANTFAQGDIGSKIGEPTISPGVVDFLDFVRFEAIYDKKNGGAGSFQQMLASVPEPSSAALVLIGLAALAGWRRRAPRGFAAVLVAATMAFSATSASAAITNTLLFSFEPGSLPDTLQRWQPAQTGGVDNATLLVQATGATQGTNALKITQTAAVTTGAFINDAFVSIFGSESGLPPQADALNSALDVGANHFKLEMDVTMRDADVPAGTGYISVAVGLSVGSDTNDLETAFTLDGSTNETVPVSIPLSIDPVVFGDNLLSVTNQQGGSYNLSIQLDGDWTGNASVYIDNVRLTQISQPALLTLEVNTVTGLGTIKNTPGIDAGTGDVIFDYYEIRSTNPAQPADFNGNGTVDAADYTIFRDNLGLMDTALQADGDANGDGDVTAADYTAWKAAFGQLAGGNGTSLNPAGWNSLDDQNVDPNGVAVIDNWAEGSPSSTSLSEARLIGSSTWNNAESRTIGNIYTPGAAHNLTFRYREPSRNNFLRTGIVTYVGAGAGGASAVPEPGTFVLALVAGLFVAVRRRA